MIFHSPICVGTLPCSINLLIMTGLFFVSAILRKQLNDNAGIDFSMIGGVVLGILAYCIVYALSGIPKWGFIAGLIGVIAGGLLGSQFLGDGSAD